METIKLSKKAIDETVRVIKSGGVVVFPTDTIYGLIADATSNSAVKKIFEIKKRKESKSIPIFVDSIKTAKKFAIITKKQEELLNKYWPGKLTAILKLKNKLALKITNRKKSIAIRIPDYPKLIEIIQKTGKPLTGTSANISGIAGSPKIKDIVNQKIQPDLIVDAGDLGENKVSTIIDLRRKKIRIVRQGAVNLS